MINTLYIAETGLNAQKTFVDVISNNIANTNTVGFKKSEVNFVDLIVSNGIDNKNENENKTISGVEITSIGQDFSQGSLKITGHPMDIAIQGEGFLPVSIGNGEVGYTRIGRLALNKNGQLTTANGFELMSDVVVPPDIKSLEIDQSGIVKGMLDGESEVTQFGQIRLVKITNPEKLAAYGDGIYVNQGEDLSINEGLPGEMGLGLIRQGYTEQSNVSMVEEMVNLVIAQRGYQLNARVIQVADQLLETINNLRR